MLTGGFGEHVSRFCLDHGYPVPSACFGVKDEFIQHGDHEHLMKDAGLDPETIAQKILFIMKGDREIG